MGVSINAGDLAMRKLLAPIRRSTARATFGLFATLICLDVAAGTLVVTDARHPVKRQGDERVIELDLPARIEAELSADLPADPDRAAALTRERLDDAVLQERLRQAYQDVTDARSLGVEKVPAVVVEAEGLRYVIYGEPDVSRAVERIEQYRRTRP
jgi:integrating conjugative element protein (TIGR03757 family)